VSHAAKARDVADVLVRVLRDPEARTTYDVVWGKKAR
jgi:hypothetical protein